MISNNINISSIETHLVSLFKGKVSDHTFAGSTLPDVTPKEWKDMCLIDCGDISDGDALGIGIVLVWLYAKPKADGTKNVATMAKMEKALNVALENQEGNTYRLNRLNTYQDYDNERKWHCNIVELNIKII